MLCENSFYLSDDIKYIDIKYSGKIVLDCELFDDVFYIFDIVYSDKDPDIKTKKF